MTSRKIKRILVFTGTRAEYGILYWFLKALQAESAVELQLLVSGSHLSNRYGSTAGYIEEDGFTISKAVSIPLDGDPHFSTSNSVAQAIMAYGDALDELQPDTVVLLGDRYEAFAMAQTAFLKNVPLVHIHGGEITEGANDERMRHAITKLSDLHFTSTRGHRQRVIQLGESPESVVCVGAPGLEHARRSELPSVAALSDTFSFDFSQPYVLLVFHPVTNARDNGLSELAALLAACNKLMRLNFVISLANADSGADDINTQLQSFAEHSSSATLIRSSFGHLNFLSVMKHACVMVGNSSSGIIEAPALKTPSIDVGDRQRGRERADSVRTLGSDLKAIEAQLLELCTKPLPESHFANPYDGGDSAQAMMRHILKANFNNMKSFHDLPQAVCA